MENGGETCPEGNQSKAFLRFKDQVRKFHYYLIDRKADSSFGFAVECYVR